MMNSMSCEQLFAIECIYCIIVPFRYHRIHKEIETKFPSQKQRMSLLLVWLLYVGCGSVRAMIEFYQNQPKTKREKWGRKRRFSILRTSPRNGTNSQLCHQDQTVF